MKTGYRMILVSAITAILLTAAVPCRAVEEEDNIWSEDMPKWKHKKHELTEEIIKGMMDHLSVEDPNKAKELEKLKEEDFEKFKTELKEAMRERRRRLREHRKEHSDKEKRGKKSRHGGMSPWRNERFLEWLKENYAEEAEKLARMSERDPNVYWKHLGFSYKKYGRIAEAARESLELAEVLKEDLSLKQQRDELLEEIKIAGGEKKDELIENLKEVVGQRFDLIVKRKHIEYEQLTERLERLKKKVKEREAKVEKWQDPKFKNDSINARLEELLGKSDKFTW